MEEQRGAVYPDSAKTRGRGGGGLSLFGKKAAAGTFGDTRKPEEIKGKVQKTRGRRGLGDTRSAEASFFGRGLCF